ncbi:hypothetical protein HY622_00850 [Candidatus Uhrbacteria bacterium]|nr:hypothetical protein [Candidatus Uhrbacteria bacterium]
MNQTAKIVLISMGASLLSAALAAVVTIMYFKAAPPRAPATATPVVQEDKPSGEQKVVEQGAPQEPDTTTSLPATVVSGQLIEDPGVVWLPKPRKLAEDLKLFRVFEYEDETLPPGVQKGKPVYAEGITYYKTGTESGNDIILATIPPEGPGDDYVAYLLRTAGGSYEYIVQNSDNYNPENKQFYGAQPIESIKINYEKVYRSVSDQETISYNGVELQSFGGYIGLETAPQSRTEVAKTPYGILYSEIRPGEVRELLVESFVLVKPNGLEETYQYIPEGILKDDGVAAVSWNDGKRNTDTFQLINTTGCGAGAFLALIAPLAVSEIVAAGTAENGDTVYEFAKVDNPVARYLYDTTNGTYYSSDGKVRTIPFKDFSQKHPLLVIKDALDRYVAYNNSAYGPAVECGKPVIYLYPKKPTDISVQVDASVHVSDPLYGDGWKVHVLPDGTLFTKDGKKYDSLFWEGQGNGSYPQIRSGFVVSRGDVKQTIEQHLRQLGLNEKERADFADFWLPRMPDTPYVRLSWLPSREMDTLAPLHISPQPDIVIRVFLDFEGLNEFVDLPPQTLKAAARNGFVVVEWGGLLRR